MQVDATSDEVDAARASIEATPGLVLVRFLDHDDAHELFRCFFAGDRKLLEQATPEQIPMSFHVAWAPGAAHLQAVLDRIEGLPGVDSVGVPDFRRSEVPGTLPV